MPLGGLDRLPVTKHLLRAADLDVAKDVGMATDDLGPERPVHIGKVEGPVLSSQLRMQDDLQEQSM